MIKIETLEKVLNILKLESDHKEIMSIQSTSEWVIIYTPNTQIKLNRLLFELND